MLRNADRRGEAACRRSAAERRRHDATLMVRRWSCRRPAKSRASEARYVPARRARQSAARCVRNMQKRQQNEVMPLWHHAARACYSKVVVSRHSSARSRIAARCRATRGM